MPLRFDLFAGAGFLWGQTLDGLSGSQDIGVAVDGQLAWGVTPGLALAARAGGVIVPYDLSFSTVYGAGGIYLPYWHWGVLIGGGSSVSPESHRQGGFVLDVPFDLAIARYFRIGVAFGLGIFPEFTQETLRLEIGI
jgi:hypothetical protein